MKTTAQLVQMMDVWDGNKIRREKALEGRKLKKCLICRKNIPIIDARGRVKPKLTYDKAKTCSISCGNLLRKKEGRSKKIVEVYLTPVDVWLSQSLNSVQLI